MSRDRNDTGSSMPPPPRRDFTFPGFPSSALRRLTSWVVVGFWTLFLGTLVWTSFYAVPADSVGIVQRFGRYVRTDDPGLRFKIPFGTDSVRLVPVRRQLKSEFGFSTPGASNPFQGSHEPAQEKIHGHG